MKEMNMPGFTAEASLYSRPVLCQTTAKGCGNGDLQVVPQFWKEIWNTITDAVDEIGEAVCSNCAAVGVGTAATCAAGTEGLGMIGGFCGIVGGVTAVGCKTACGK